MLGDRTIISHLGLPPREATVIRSLFSLDPTLQQAFELVEDADVMHADVVFVNTEEEHALSAWRQVAQQNRLAIPVMVVPKGQRDYPGLHVHRPLVLRKLVDVLELATSTRQHKLHHASHSEARVLVVDDSYPVRKFMSHNLPRYAARQIIVDLAESGEEAKRMISEVEYQLIFLDIMMPDIDGYKLCKWIKSQRKAPVVMLSSKSGSFDKVRGAVAGCDSYLTKPPAEKKLAAVLNKFIPAAPRQVRLAESISS